MHITTHELLRCPFCGTRPALVEGSPTIREGDEIAAGVLGCQCCAFPVLEGIPVLIASDKVRDAMHRLEAGEPEAALVTLMDLDGPRVEAFRAFVQRGDRATYREALEILSVDAEADYLIHRFSDPTFRVADALMRAVGSHPRLTGRTIDVAGGSGHLTRVLASISSSPVVLADVFFWKLWLAKRFMIPDGEPVCCDANNPLPFASEAFTTVLLADAFPYIWQKRLLAAELMRLAGPDGAIVMPHLHSALGENFTAGMTLTPEAYRDLFDGHGPRLFRDSALLDDVLDRGVLDLGADSDPSTLAGEAAVALVASRHADVFRNYDLARLPPPPAGEVIVNPLYRVDYHDGVSRLALAFPTADYAEEFAAVRRYLPESLEVRGDLRDPAVRAKADRDDEELRRRLVFIEAPKGYC